MHGDRVVELALSAQVHHLVHMTTRDPPDTLFHGTQVLRLEPMLRQQPVFHVLGRVHLRQHTLLAGLAGRVFEVDIILRRDEINTTPKQIILARYFLNVLVFRGYPEWRVTLKRSEEHTSELQSLMRNSYAVFC